MAENTDPLLATSPSSSAPIMESVILEDADLERMLKPPQGTVVTTPAPATVAPATSSSIESDEEDVAAGSPAGPSTTAAAAAPVPKPTVITAEDKALAGASSFEIRIGEAVKSGEGMDAHIVYKLYVRTNNPNYQKPEFEASRRYKDFLWLHGQLVGEFKGIVIPPLPEKGIVKRFDQRWIDYRKREFERFLSRVAAVPSLAASKPLQTFLEASTEILIENRSKTGGFSATKMFSTVGNVAQSLLTSVTENDPFFEAKKDYLLKLEAKLTNVAKAANGLVRRRKELLIGYAELSTSLSEVGTLEKEGNADVGSAFGRAGEITGLLSELNRELADEETFQLEEEVRDYLRMVSAVKDSLAQRMAALAAFQAATKALSAKREKLGKAKANAAGKLQKEIEEAEKRVDDARTEFTQLSDTCRAELDRFDKNKARDMEELITRLTQLHMNCELRALDQWKRLLSDLQDFKERLAK